MIQQTTAKLGEILQRSTEMIEILPDESYKEITVKLWGKGVVIRGIVNGAEISGARRFVARKGQLILSRIDARNGAIGIVPEPLDGAVVSNDFPLFNVNEDRAVGFYIGWLSKTADFVELCQRASEGTTNRVRLQEERFLSLEVPLPLPPEQRRAVARIEELAAKINEATGLRQKAAEEVDLLVPRKTTSCLDEAGWRKKPLSEILAEFPRNGISPKPKVDTGGRPILRINAVSSSKTRFVDMTATNNVEASDAECAPFVLLPDDVFIVRYNGDINRVAKAAIFKSDEPCHAVFPDKLMRLRPDRRKMSPDFLVYAMSVRSVRYQVEEIGKTTAGNIGISGANAKSFIVPVPPIDEQGRIVAELDALQAQVDALKRLQAETASEIGALLPSILDKAFRGEL